MTTSVYEPEAFSSRVSYARHCIIDGTTSRAFDTCFEMSDGDAVVTALIRKTEQGDEKLRRAFERNMDWFSYLRGEAAKHSGVKDLKAFARQLRSR